MFSCLELIPGNFTELQWEEYYRLRQEFSLRFEDAVPPYLEAFRDDTLHRMAKMNVRIFIFLDGGKMCGYFRYWIINKDHPTAQNNSVHCYVLPEFLTPQLEQVIVTGIFNAMQEAGHERSLWRTLQPEMKALAEKAGGRLSNSGYWFRLKFSDLQEELLEKWKKNDRIASEKISVDWVGFIPEELLEEVAHVSNLMVNDMNREDRSIPFHIDAAYLRNSQENSRKAGQVPVHLLLRNAEKRLVGISLVLISKDSEIADQRLTGVIAEQRGKGLAKWMKALMLGKIREEFPFITSFRTECFSANLPMIAINKAMGYEIYRTDHDFFLYRHVLAGFLKAS